MTPSVRDFGNGVHTVVPDLTHARRIIEHAFAHPDQVREQLAYAAEIAGHRFCLAATTAVLTRYLAAHLPHPELAGEVVPA